MTNDNMNRADYMDALVDGAFVPEAGSRSKPAATMQGRLREEASGKSEAAAVRAELSLKDILADVKVEKFFLGKPEDGLHKIKIYGELEAKVGYNGNSDYVVMQLTDTETMNVWKTYVSVEDLGHTLAEISFNNNGILATLGGLKAIERLQKKPFACWTVNTESGTIKTYFSEEKYNKYMSYKAYKEGQKELKQLKEKERADEKERMAEEAELSK